jgi:NAD(P)-dependent dehydrogenase (short-subunit alcohol dehydrogenase family)
MTMARPTHVVVTGAGQGIGRAVALAFARDGARVVLVARSAERLEAVAEEVRAGGAEALAVPADVGDRSAVERLAATAVERWGPPDALVAAAGTTGPTAPLWEVEPTDWDDTLRANLTGVFLTCRAFLPAMVERRAGSVVVVGSMTGKRPLPGRTPYAAAKTGLIGLVRTLAWDAGAAGVRVNLVSPGPVEGERLVRVLEAQATARSITPDQARAELAASSPLRRFATEEDVARAVRFLCSDDAAAITGEDLNVSGGTVTYG